MSDSNSELKKNILLNIELQEHIRNIIRGVVRRQTIVMVGMILVSLLTIFLFFFMVSKNTTAEYLQRERDLITTERERIDKSRKAADSARFQLLELHKVLLKRDSIIFDIQNEGLRK
jgi:hypothetical protein